MSCRNLSYPWATGAASVVALKPKVMFEDKNFDVPYADVAQQLAETARPLFPLPDDSEVALNLVSMANFLPLIEDIIGAFQPEIVCEIGAYRGITTRALKKLGSTLGFELHVVDPAIEAEGLEPGLTRFQMLSVDYLQQDRGASIFFLDGDHNYFTVTAELKLLAAHAAKRPSVLFLHDVGWPCGRRDMYYLPDTIPESARHEMGEGFNLSVLSTGPSTLGIPVDIQTALKDGGEANGVLTAIEDFVADNSGWQYISLPSVFGLGVLWHPDLLDERQREVMEAKRRQFDQLSPFLATLELNRLQLLSAIQQAGEEWHACQAAIADQAEKLARFQQKSGLFAGLLRRLKRTLAN